jgi:glycosyltransferase involved in cell wall biosynthesis
VPERLLPGLFAGAEAFALPSLYEGFGLPVLEAMACGTPVVASHLTALPETAGGAARLAPPDEVAEATRDLLGDEVERERLRDAGLRRAKEFTWARTAAEMHALLSAL